MWDLEKQDGVKEYIFKLFSKPLTTCLPIMLVIQLVTRINFSIELALSSWLWYHCEGIKSTVARIACGISPGVALPN